MHFVPRWASVTCYSGSRATGILPYLCEMLFRACKLRNIFYWKS